MKRKQAIKLTRDLPEELVLRCLVYGNYRLLDYFLVGQDGHYQCGIWDSEGQPNIIMSFNEDQAIDFAIEKYLLRNVPVFKNEAEVPKRQNVSATVQEIC